MFHFHMDVRGYPSGPAVFLFCSNTRWLASMLMKIQGLCTILSFLALSLLLGCSTFHVLEGLRQWTVRS